MLASKDGVARLIAELHKTTGSPVLPPAPPLPPSGGDGTPRGMDPWQNSVESRLGSVDGRIGRIEADLSAMKNDIATIKTDVAVMKATMASKDDLRGLDKAIGTRLQVYLGIVVAILTAVTVGTKLLGG